LIKDHKFVNILIRFTSCVKWILLSTGIFAFIMVTLAFTTAPFWIWYNMGVKKAGIHRPPDFIIVMGGSGMPSESGLMRCWYASKVANHFTRARIIIALPGDAEDSLSSVNQMKKEMELRGISPQRIMFENSGTNTRAEALNIYKIISNIQSSRVTRHASPDSSRVTRHASLLIVTSPEHLYRAVLTFKKAGFMKVDGVPAFEKTIEADLSFTARKLGARKWVPDVGKNLTIRYQFWVHLEYELLVLREWFALGYYKLQGWI
jgi:uncharacterized SAM-binding protein YcdF (DUF218 family)